MRHLVGEVAWLVWWVFMHRTWSQCLDRREEKVAKMVYTARRP